MKSINIMFVSLFMICSTFRLCRSDLSVGFYQKSCSQFEDISNQVVKSFIDQEPRMAASILRLHFHDCFVQGCDGSILLDETPTIQSEKTAIPNNNSVRGFEVIDGIKTKLEQTCPGVVSCADILAVAARDSVFLSGGPKWDVKKGRRDSTSAFQTVANTNLPAPSFSLSTLLAAFEKQGLTLVDLVTLSGAHTIGKARCATFKKRLYNTSDLIINQEFLSETKDQCPPSGGDDRLSTLDLGSSIAFDNDYFLNIKAQKVLLNSDQALYDPKNPSMVVVDAFAEDNDLFSSQFPVSMLKMAGLNPLTGTQGEIRRNCRKVNSDSS